LLVAACALNAVVDPYGYVGAGVFRKAIVSDRSTKACLAERLAVAPRMLVLGSSRAMKVEPTYVASLTGRPTFNAAVSSASPQDAWAFVNLLHDRFGGGRQEVIWLVDVEAFRPKAVDPGLLQTPALSRYFSMSSRWQAQARGLTTLFSWQTAADSVRVLRRTVAGDTATSAVPCTYRTNGVTEYAVDGFRRWDYHDVAAVKGVGLSENIDVTTSQYRDIYRNRLSRCSTAGTSARSSSSRPCTPSSGGRSGRSDGAAVAPTSSPTSRRFEPGGAWISSMLRTSRASADARTTSTTAST
jgi:hypothetical protein